MPKTSLHQVPAKKPHGICARESVIVANGLAFLVTASALLGGAAESADQKVVVEVENRSQPHGYELGNTPRTAPTIYPVLTAMHDGSLDLFDFGQPVSDELGLLASESLIAPLVEVTRQEAQDSAVINIVTNNFMGNANPFEFESFAAREQNVDPLRHRFFSFAAKLGPSDDAFVGNDDPRQYELFDEQGVYQGPLIIKVYGQAVLDAGVKLNEEQDLPWKDREPDPSAQLARDERDTDSVHFHPGYNGSQANPDGMPQGILGREGASCDSSLRNRCISIDPVAGDFKQAGYLIAVIRVSAGLDSSYSGFWYDPQRSGEGFNVSLFEGTPPTMAVAWYTYAPDGSGQQVYLVGSGPVSHDFATVELFRSEDGAFASTGNPESVRNEAWGTIQLGFGRCDEGRVFYFPSDPGYPSGDYFLTRLGPTNVGQQENCSFESLGLFNPPDNDWPFPAQTIAPDPGPQP